MAAGDSKLRDVFLFFGFLLFPRTQWSRYISRSKRAGWCRSQERPKPLCGDFMEASRPLFSFLLLGRFDLVVQELRGWFPI